MPYIGNIVQDFSVNTAMLNTDSVTSIKVLDGTIVNADINDSAAIAMSKLALSITNSEVNASAAIAKSKIETFVNTNADNRVITGSGTANTLNGESTLTYDASLLNITSTTQGLGLRLTNTGNEYTSVRFDAARTGAASALGILEGRWNNSQNVCAIYLQTGDDTTNKDDGRISMLVQSASGANKTALKIEPDASVQLPNDSQKLQIGNDQDLNLWHGGTNGYIDNETGSLFFRVTASNTTALGLDSSGRLLIGHTSSIPAASGSVAFSLQVVGTGFASSTVNNQRYENGQSGASILLNHSRGTVGNHTILQTNDELGKIRFYGSDGNDFDNYGAEINASVDASPGNNAMPGRLTFKTTTTSSPSPAERMRIDSQGRVKISAVGATISDHSSATTHTPLYLQTVTDLTAVGTAEGAATTGLFRMFDVSTSADRYHGIELRNKSNGDIRILNQDRNTSDRGDLVVGMPQAGNAGGIQEKIRISGIYDSVNIAGKGGATLLGPSDSGYNKQKVDFYMSTKTGVTAIDTQAGDEVAGLIRFEDTGSNNNRFHGIELRNRNSGDCRILNKDVGASNKADMAFAVDSGSGIVEVARFLNSGGLAFGGSTASQHALKDYEEGTWTPGLAFGNTDTGMTYSSRSGSFIKIGTWVYCQGQLDLSSKGSSTGDATFTNLPFTVGDYVSGTSQEGSGFISWWASSGSSDFAPAVFWVSEGGTSAAIYRTNNGTSIQSQTNAQWANNTQVRFFVQYRST